ncbi:hypothetical protein BCR44DRAFT_1425267 [Catenaria anguillulae PL171]|uniref:F-box domain-containing protein n=1 Tax=Catenaria anguillulae PL171 TaxID=765915 RepID=A0A1Y2I107_9FUNG|nr:hypothetical protein BCR44DRAFT_1425267 [Catenaria anguillulae PL171]
MADPRFTLAIQSRLFTYSSPDLGMPDLCEFADAILHNQHTHRSMLWGHMLRYISVYPRFPAGHVSRTLQSGRWQFVHLDAEPNDKPSKWFMPPALHANPCLKLLLVLPYDLQLYLGAFLNSPSVARLRATCRELNDFPMTKQFLQDRLERALRHSALPNPHPQSGSLSPYDPHAMRKFIKEAPNDQGPSTLHYRPFIEAVRHLDADLALSYLQPQSRANAALYDPRQSPNCALVYYVYPWALYTLLNQSPVSHPDPNPEQHQRARLILVALLLRPSLPLSAWFFLVHANTPTMHHGQGSTMSLTARLVHIVQFGTLPTTPGNDDLIRLILQFNPHLLFLLVYLYGTVDTLHAIMPVLGYERAAQLVSALDYLNQVKDCSGRHLHLSLDMIRAVYAIVYRDHVAWQSDAVFKYCMQVSRRCGTYDLLLDVICAYMDEQQEQEHVWRMVDQLSEKGLWQAHALIKVLCVLVFKFPKWKTEFKARTRAHCMEPQKVKHQVAQFILLLGSNIDKISRVCLESDTIGCNQLREIEQELAKLHGLWKPIRRKLATKWSLMGKVKVRVERAFGLEMP